MRYLIMLLLLVNLAYFGYQMLVSAEVIPAISLITPFDHSSDVFDVVTPLTLAASQ